MYKHTNKSYKDVTNDLRNYIDHISRNSTKLEDRLDKIDLDDNNRHLHYYIKLFRAHAEREDYNTALIMLAITRNKVYKYVARALNAGVDFNITHAAHVLNDIEEYMHATKVKIASQK